jgi:hypothetical protein
VKMPVVLELPTAEKETGGFPGTGWRLGAGDFP